MTAPTAALDAVSDVVRKSGLVPADRLAEFLAGFGDRDPAELLPGLREAGLLTRFQAAQLARGKWKGFLLGTHYRILDAVGKGGMGTVFLAEHTVMRKKVAIKVLTPELADDPVALARFTREARAAAACDHPNVVHMIDIDPDAKPAFLVMEFVDGITLQAAVATTGPFPAESAAFCGVQALLGLQKAHEMRLVHRDVKPANVIVDRKGVVKLLDLGIVRTNNSDGLTLAGGKMKLILGTADYLAPEQAINSSDVDTRADIYALGATVYFLLAGHPPFDGGNPAQKLMRKQMQPPPAIESLRPDVCPGLAAVIARMLAIKPADRYDTPAMAAEALAPFAAPEPAFPNRLFGQSTDLLTTPPPVGRLTDSPTGRLLMAVGRGSDLHIHLPGGPSSASLTPPPRPADPPPTEVLLPSPAPVRRSKAPWAVAAGAAGVVLAGLAAWLTAG
jgi:serine/threonine-protein kinase